jgi:hypothetical protein
MSPLRPARIQTANSARKYIIFAFAAPCLCAMSAFTNANEFCVTTASEFQSALTQAAADNSGPDYVSLVGGTYKTSAINDSFHYSSTTAHDLYIIGGFAAGCHGEGSATVLDGGQMDRVLETRSTQGAVYIEDLTIQNGSAPNGAGLQMNPNAGENGGVAVIACIIQNNHAGESFGGLEISTGPNGFLDITNSLIVNNNANISIGAARVTVDPSVSAVAIVNNTVTGNVSGDATQSGGLQFVGNGGFISNNIFWNNTLSGLELDDPAVLTNNDIGNLTGDTSPSVGSTGNVSLDPNFVDAAQGDFHLSGSSRLLGIGKSMGNGVDLDGHNYFAGQAIDLGAYQETIFTDGFDGN